MWGCTRRKNSISENSRIPITGGLSAKQSGDIAAHTRRGTILNGNGESEGVEPSVSANFFSVLGVDAIRGRTFQTDEDKQGGPRVVV
jgi:hypothetical protein